MTKTSTHCVPCFSPTGAWGPAAAAKRICAELGLQPSSEGLVTDQIKNGLRRYDSWPAGDPCVQRKRRVLLEVVVDVTLDGLRLTDRMLWDPYSTFNDTAAHDIAAVTCADLGLPGCDAIGVVCHVRLLFAHTDAPGAMTFSSGVNGRVP